MIHFVTRWMPRTEGPSIGPTMNALCFLSVRTLTTSGTNRGFANNHTWTTSGIFTSLRVGMIKAASAPSPAASISSTPHLVSLTRIFLPYKLRSVERTVRLAISYTQIPRVSRWIELVRSMISTTTTLFLNGHRHGSSKKCMGSKENVKGSATRLGVVLVQLLIQNGGGLSEIGWNCTRLSITTSTPYSGLQQSCMRHDTLKRKAMLAAVVA